MQLQGLRFFPSVARGSSWRDTFAVSIIVGWLLLNWVNASSAFCSSWTFFIVDSWSRLITSQFWLYATWSWLESWVVGVAVQNPWASTTGISHVAFFSCVEGWPSSLCCGGIKDLLFGTPLSMVLVLAPISLGLHSLLWSFGLWRYTWFWPNLNGACCSTISLCRILVFVSLSWRDKGFRSRFLFTSGACDCIILLCTRLPSSLCCGALCCGGMKGFQPLFFLGLYSQYLWNHHLRTLKIVVVAFWYFGFLPGRQQVHFLLL